jgi:hypothetical protein
VWTFQSKTYTKKNNKYLYSGKNLHEEKKSTYILVKKDSEWVIVV